MTYPAFPSGERAVIAAVHAGYVEVLDLLDDTDFHMREHREEWLRLQQRAATRERPPCTLTAAEMDLATAWTRALRHAAADRRRQVKRELELNDFRDPWVPADAAPFVACHEQFSRAFASLNVRGGR